MKTGACIIKLFTAVIVKLVCLYKFLKVTNNNNDKSLLRHDLFKMYFIVVKVCISKGWSEIKIKSLQNYEIVSEYYQMK